MSALPYEALPQCVSCGGRVEHVELYEIVGFEHERAQGGTNHVIARKRTGRVVGDCCAHRVKQGVPIEQGRLL